MTKKFYILHYDRVWSLTPMRYHDFLTNGWYGREWNLDNYGKKLKNYPKGLKPGGESRITFIEPIDWGVDEFSENLNEFEKMHFSVREKK